MNNHRAIDLWVNVNMGAGIPPEFLQRVKEDYFKGGEDFFRSLSVDECLEQMDDAGVEKAVISTSGRCSFELISNSVALVPSPASTEIAKIDS